MHVIIKIDEVERGFLDVLNRDYIRNFSNPKTRPTLPYLILDKNFPCLANEEKEDKIESIFVQIEDKIAYRFVRHAVRKIYCTGIADEETYKHKYSLIIEESVKNNKKCFLEYADYKLKGDNGCLFEPERLEKLNLTEEEFGIKFRGIEVYDCRTDNRLAIIERIFNDYGIPFANNEEAKEIEWLVRYGKTTEEKGALEKRIIEIAYNYLANSHQTLLATELKNHLEKELKRLK